MQRLSRLDRHPINMQLSSWRLRRRYVAPVQLEVGDAVLVHSQVSRPELNGLRGTVRGLLASEDGKYEVWRLSDAKPEDVIGWYQMTRSLTRCVPRSVYAG